VPRFFFHVYDDVEALDEDGLDLPDVKAAHLEALRSARALACEQVEKGYLNLHHRIDVEDDAGRRVTTVSFRDAVAVTG
jgi:hypothetical protein